MDTSEIYIKMCDCPEIQDDFWKLIEKDGKERRKRFDRFRGTKYSPRIPEISCPDVAVYDSGGKILKLTSLPLQDQIQEMCGFDKNFKAEIYDYVCDLYRFMGEINPLDYSSFEQLWLAFYMHKKHGKIWDGEQWTEEK